MTKQSLTTLTDRQVLACVLGILAVGFLLGRAQGLNQREPALYTGYIGGFCDGMLTAAAITEVAEPESYDSEVRDVEGDPITTEDAYWQVGDTVVSLGELAYEVSGLPYRPYGEPLPASGSSMADYGRAACAHGLDPFGTYSDHARAEAVLNDWKW